MLSVCAKDEAEAVAMANHSRYAFAGGIFTRDLARAMRLVREVRRTLVGQRIGCPAVRAFGGFKGEWVYVVWSYYP